MKSRILALALALCAAPSVLAAQTPSGETETTSLRAQLMPAGSAVSLSARTLAHDVASEKPVTTTVQSRGGGMGYMIAGGALFVAGLLAGGDAGTVLILAGAGIGAYGLYLHFR
jgi:hypothetical protein